MPTAETEVDHLLSTYVHMATEHGKALERGDVRKSDEINMKLIEAFRELKVLGARERLTDLMSHPNRSVRCWGAIHSLRIAPEAALRTLAALAEEEGPVAFNALIFSREWSKGTITIVGDD